jgi:hypothetical protein
MNLKPFRQIDEYEVINLLAPSFISGDKGAAVTADGNGWVNGSDLEATSISAYANTYSARYANPAKFSLAASGTAANKVLGIMAFDVREENFLGVSLKYDPIRKKEAQVCLSGESCPVITRGLVLVSGYQGTAGFGSGAKVSNSGDGIWVVTNGTDTADFGRFLGAADTDGYALFEIQL